jgi:hypothetical protein
MASSTVILGLKLKRPRCHHGGPGPQARTTTVGLAAGLAAPKQTLVRRSPHPYGRRFEKLAQNVTAASESGILSGDNGPCSLSVNAALNIRLISIPSLTQGCSSAGTAR